MADMRGTTPVKSIRMSDETKGLFDKINKEFGSQDRTMRALISAYESCAIGELYPESKSYITDALAYISGIEAIIKALINIDCIGSMMIFSNQFLNSGAAKKYNRVPVKAPSARPYKILRTS